MNSGKADPLPATGDQNSQLKQFFRASFPPGRNSTIALTCMPGFIRSVGPQPSRLSMNSDCPKDRLCWMWDADQVSRRLHLRARVIGSTA